MSTFLNSCHSYLPQFLLFLPSSISSISYLPQFLPFLPSSISSIPTLLNFFYFLPSSIPAIPTLLKSFYFYLPQFHLYLPSPFLLFLPSSIPSIPTFLNSFYTYPRHFFYSYSPHFFHSYPPWFLLFLPSSLQFQSYTPIPPPLPLRLLLRLCWSDSKTLKHFNMFIHIQTRNHNFVFISYISAIFPTGWPIVHCTYR